MAQPGSTFDSKYPWHSQLCGIAQPIKLKVTGSKRYRDTEATTYFIKIEGDAEGEYGIKSETADDSYDEALRSIPLNVPVEVVFEGDGKKGEGMVYVTVPEGAVASPEPRQAPQARSTGGSAPRPAGLPWGSMEERYLQALQAGGRCLGLVPDRKFTMEDLRAAAATLMIGQVDVFRQTGCWLPMAAGDAAPAEPEDEQGAPDMATAEELQGLKAAFDPVAFHVPEKERKGIEAILRDGAPLERVVAARGFIAAVTEKVRMAETAAEKSVNKQPPPPPPAEAIDEEQEALAMAGEDDLPF